MESLSSTVAYKKHGLSIQTSVLPLCKRHSLGYTSAIQLSRQNTFSLFYVYIYFSSSGCWKTPIFFLNICFSCKRMSKTRANYVIHFQYNYTRSPGHAFEMPIVKNDFCKFWFEKVTYVFRVFFFFFFFFWFFFFFFFLPFLFSFSFLFLLLWLTFYWACLQLKNNFSESVMETGNF